MGICICKANITKISESQTLKNETKTIMSAPYYKIVQLFLLKYNHVTQFEKNIGTFV